LSGAGSSPEQFVPQALVMRWAGHVAWAVGVPAEPDQLVAQVSAGVEAVGPVTKGTHSSVQHSGFGTDAAVMHGGGASGGAMVVTPGGMEVTHGGMEVTHSAAGDDTEGVQVSAWAGARSAWRCLRPAPHLIALPGKFQDLFLPVKDKVSEPSAHIGKRLSVRTRLYDDTFPHVASA
jgi:hypothetical protein